MNARLGRRPWLAAAGLLLLGLRPATAAVPGGREIIERMESLIWADTMQGEFEMRIVTPRWDRTLALRIWMDRPRRSFVRVLAPPKEAGIGSLRIGNEMWNYLPSVERTIRIPPSMMLQPWMGSDFTNDDLVKQSSAIDDYTQQVLGEEVVDGQLLWKVEALPKPEAAVVGGRLVYWVRKDFIPVRQEFFSERGELVRVMRFSEIRPVGGRTIPTRWEIRPLGKPGQFTVITVRDAAYNIKLDEDVFTQRNLQRR
ncbi:MAG: outer membrane lipoprotein-sorting protein [Gammaproteobacteria bacterium]